MENFITGFSGHERQHRAAILAVLGKEKYEYFFEKVKAPDQISRETGSSQYHSLVFRLLLYTIRCQIFRLVRTELRPHTLQLPTFRRRLQPRRISRARLQTARPSGGTLLRRGSLCYSRSTCRSWWTEPRLAF